MPGRIGRKHPHLTILHLTQGATVLPRHTHRLPALFGKSRLINKQYPLGISHIVMEQAMVRPTHLRFIPHPIADESLHRTDVSPFHLQCHRLDRFAFQGTELPHHVPKELRPRLAPRKTLAEGFMKTPQFVQESCDIALNKRKLWDGKHLAFGPISW